MAPSRKYCEFWNRYLLEKTDPVLSPRNVQDPLRPNSLGMKNTNTNQFIYLIASCRHKLIRIPCFKSPILHEDLPSIVAIELRCSKDGLHTLHLFGGLPMAKVVKLFRQVESEINYEDTRPHSPNVMAGQMLPRRITAVKIHSLKSFRPITKMPTHLIRLVWYHICLEMGLKDPCATDDE